MTEYFQQFPNIQYSFNPSAKDFYTVVNLFARVKMLDDVLSNALVYYPYSVKDSDSIEIIAHKYYGDTKRHWVVMFANQIIDPYFDFSLRNDALEENIMAQFGSLQNAQSTVHHVEQRVVTTTNFNGNVTTSYSNTTLFSPFTYDFKTKQIQSITLPNIQFPEILVSTTIVNLNATETTIPIDGVFDYSIPVVANGSVFVLPIYSNGAPYSVVSINGLMLSPNTDYTIFDKTLTLSANAIIGDIIDVEILTEISNVVDFSAVSTENQIIFNLPSIPTSQNCVIASINGLVQIPGDDYTITGNVLTFSDPTSLNDNVDFRILTIDNSDIFDFVINVSSIQTTFVLPPAVSNATMLSVSINGILQVPTIDYSIISNNVLSFSNSCLPGDLLDIRWFFPSNSVIQMSGSGNDSGIIVTTTTTLFAVSYYDYLIQQNEANRQIKLLDKQYVAAVESQLSSLLRQ